MSIGLQVWSQTASANSTADTNINWAEGMAPSQVNDSARAEMASMAKWRDDNNGTLVTAGTTLAYTVTSNQVEGALTAGYTVAFQMHATNDVAATLAVDSLAAKPLQVICGTNLSGGELLVGNIYRATYSTTGTGQWIINSGDAVGAGGIGTFQLADGAVTYNKIQTPGASVLLGNPSTSTSTGYKEVTLGTGLIFSGATITAPQFPPTASFKNLVIKVTGNSTANASADFVTVATSGSSAFQTLAFASHGIDFANSGSVNQLDTGAIAGANTWYGVYAIATAAGTSVGYLVSTSFTTPAMPSGFTYKARIGALVTSTSTTSVALLGTWQFGRRASYVVGLAGTSASVTIASSGKGSYDATSPTLTGITVNNVSVPPTASIIKACINQAYKSGGGVGVICAPSTAYSGTNNGPEGTNGIIPPLWSGGANVIMEADITLESTQVFVATQNGAAVLCKGWEDNI